MLSRILRIASFRVRLLAVVWIGFTILVATGVHGSSIAQSSRLWSSRGTDGGYVLGGIAKRLNPKLRDLFLPKGRIIRWDEWAHTTPSALAQFSHVPRFPVTNENIAAGQNMLLIPWVPVAHVSSVARPVTWGYFLFGRANGLAWAWWFPTCFCFSVLLFLFHRLFGGDNFLACVGALWFCCSAYVVCWSLWPAQVVGWAAATTLCAREILEERRWWSRLLCGVALGVCLAAFAMHLYPPWLVPLAYTFALLFIALAVRDKKLANFRRPWVIVAFAVSVSVALSILVPFVMATRPALEQIAHAIYPGQRRLQGGDTSLLKLFGGFFNFMTTRHEYRALGNESEMAGFFIFLPAVLLAIAVSRQARKSFSVVAWTMLIVAGVIVVYARVGFPRWLAMITLFDRVQGFRAQIALGFASIVLALELLRISGEQKILETRKAVLLIVLCFAVYLWMGFNLFHIANVHGWFVPLIVGLGAAAASGALLMGQRRVFVLLLVGGLVVTSATFNPLYRGVPSVSQSELKRAVDRVETPAMPSKDRASWLVFGTDYSLGMTMAVMGARSFVGIHMHPKPDAWRFLDPTQQLTDDYNRYAVVTLKQRPLRDPKVSIVLASPQVVRIDTAADAPVWRQMGARYAIAFGGDGYLQNDPEDTHGMRLLYRSAFSEPKFSIWALPTDWPSN